VFVAEVSGQIAGFAAVVDGELEGLFVEPKLWRRGIGTALVDAATHAARKRGLTLSVVAGSSARRFYERCGFTFEGEAQTRFGPAIRMTK
jgi:GNAT superfamily N-acetyltransferase